MRTVGERLRQAREFRGLSGDALARLVGYKTQSGIANLENRATGHGGYKLTLIAQRLNVSLTWLLNGPDTDNMTTVPGFNEQAPAIAREPLAQYSSMGSDIRAEAHRLLDNMDERGILAVISTLRLLAEANPVTPKTDGSGVSAAAQKRAA